MQCKDEHDEEEAERMCQMLRGKSTLHYIDIFQARWEEGWWLVNAVY
jgi:hypothetical protein